MDPLTHGLLGGCAAQLALRRRADLPLAAAGLFAALAPDLDVLIRSSADPTLTWFLHRHFTHSLLFIPVGGLIVALILWVFYRRRYRFFWIYLAATVGYATHALLDASTSYGTLLFWPWSDRRVFWDILPIIDPVVTVLLFLGFAFSAVRRSAVPALVALFGVALYTLAAGYQHQRGLDLQRHLAEGRGHSLSHGRVMPTVGNILVWRSIYESEGKLYADALRLSPWGGEKFWEGESKEKFRKESISPPVPPGSKLDRDLNRFQWFADGYLILMDPELGVIGDARFGSETWGLQPFWGVRAYWNHPEKSVQKVRFRFPFGEALKNLWRQIRGAYPG